MVMINKTSSKPYYEQLILSIKEDILHGVLRPGDQIPSVREMAKRLLMNPNTVKALDSVPRDERRIQQLKERLKELVIEAGHLQISIQEITAWVTVFEEELGGINK